MSNEAVGKYHDNSKHSASGTNTCGCLVQLVPDASRSFGYRFLRAYDEQAILSCPKCGHVLRPEEFVDEYESEEERERREHREHFLATVSEQVAQGQENLATALARLNELFEMMNPSDEWYGTDFYQPMRLVEESITILKLLSETNNPI